MIAPSKSLWTRLQRRLIRSGQSSSPISRLGRWYGRRRGWKLCYGPRVIIDRPGESIQSTMLELGVYEPEVVSTLMAALDPGDLLIDVGGNVGQYTLIAAYRGVYVHVFEPVPRLADRLLENVDLNNLGRFVTLRGAALSNRKGSAELYVARRDDDGSHSLLAGVPAESVEVIRTETLTLDDYLATTGLRPAAIKIDVEGAEALVLDGAAETLDRDDRPVLVLETGDRLADRIGESARSVLGRLSRRRYRIFRIAEDSGALNEIAASEAGSELANYVAVPETSARLERILAANAGGVS